MIAALLAGLIVGLVHVLSGPDHLSAIAPIACMERRRVWAVGLRWGLGHSLGVVIVGLIAGLMAHWAMVDPLSASSERLVGVMLLIIGSWGLWRLARMPSRQASSLMTPTTALTGKVTILANIHVHAEGETSHHGHHHHQPGTGSHRLAPYAIGILHGCAGGSHLVGILLALAFPTFAGVMSYLAGFVAGSALAMCAFAAGIGWLAAVRGVSSGFQRGMVAVSSCVTLGIGCWWLVG